MTLLKPEQAAKARLLGRKDAAAYVGLSANTFDQEVAKGTFPAPIKVKCRRKLWDKVALDQRLDQLSGLKQVSNSAKWLERFRNGDSAAVRHRHP